MKKYAHNALVTFPKVPHVHIKLLIIDEFWNTCGKGPLTLPSPKVLTPARSSMRLRSGFMEVRMLAPVGPFFWPSPFRSLNDFF